MAKNAQTDNPTNNRIGKPLLLLATVMTIVVPLLSGLVTIVSAGYTSGQEAEAFKGQIKALATKDSEQDLRINDHEDRIRSNEKRMSEDITAIKSQLSFLVQQARDGQR